MRKLSINLFFACLVLFITGCTNTAVRHHQDYQEAAKNVGSVVIFPADVEVELIVFDGDNERLTEKEDLIRAELHSIAKTKLEQENLKVIEFNFKQEAENDENFAYAVTQVKEAWNLAKQEMYKKGVVSEKNKADFQTNLGSILNFVAEKTNADSALLIHFNAYEKSDGVIAKDVTTSILVGLLTAGAVVPVQATQGSFIDVALIETTSGKILWANRRVGAAANSSVADGVLKELPDLVWKTEVPITAEAAPEQIAVEQTAPENVASELATSEAGDTSKQ
ncbi:MULTISPECIES: hypothetical protein [Shewanella]|uniref:Lipoprotein n=1 Tax=Shewanella marisflavi TaxID=260364 RepID=A0ABX5WHU8_9GAMM|nr:MULTISPECIES: hypothetical protein [Shewanella]QDF74068.1 hypothetical protein FGA12_02215 [Shewanella marisflavi]